MADHAPAVPPSTKGRAIAAVVCLVLAVLLTAPAGFAFWGQRTINDSERYLDTVGPLVDSPEVQAAIATKVSDALEAQVDVEAVLTDVFAGVIDDRPRLDALIGPLSGAITGLIQTQVRAFVASDQFRSFWLEANTRAQVLMLAVLRGEDTGAVSVEGDQVVLDVSEAIEVVRARLVDRGLTILQNVPVPDADRQIVLLDAPQLRQARTIYAFSNPVARWLLPLVALLYVAAWVLARRKGRMTVLIGVAIAANAVLVALMLSVGRQLFVNELSNTVFGPASTAFYETLLAYLQRGTRTLLWLGLLLVAVGWFTGGTATGTSVRTSVGRGLETLGAGLAGGPLAGTATFVATNARWLRWVALAAGVVVLLWGNAPTAARLGWAAGLTLALLAALQMLVGAARTAAASVGPAVGPSGGPGTDPAGGPADDAAGDVALPTPVLSADAAAT